MHVEVNHVLYSSASELGGIQIEEQPKGMERPSFIRMDPPRHDEQRKVVSPIVAPGNLANMEALIRERTIRVLDELPRGEAFDWVDRVSVELTTMMLATLFDFPFEERRKLTYWSDVAICNVNSPDAPVHSEQERFEVMKEMAADAGRDVERAGQGTAEIRPAVDAGARRIDARAAAARVHGHAGAADRRRQRHHAQFHERRADGAGCQSRASIRSCGTTRR